MGPWVRALRKGEYSGTIAHRMSKTLRKVASFVVRWGIAVAGIWWIVSQMSISDQTLILNEQSRPQPMVVRGQIAAERYLLEDPQTGQTVEKDARELLSKPDRKTVAIGTEGGTREVALLALDVASDEGEHLAVNRLLVADTPDGRGYFITPEQVSGGFVLNVPHPRIETGIGRMVRSANPWLLVLAVAIFPVTITMTSIRWMRLLEALQIQMPLFRATVLNMVGMFYNACVPMGSSGGDLLKAYYAAQHTPYKTRAVLSVIIDRVIGLIVLIILGGTIAGGYWILAESKASPAVRACGYVAIMGALIMAATALFLAVCFSPLVKRILQSERVLSRLPMRTQIQGAFEVMAIYRQRPALIVWAMLMTVPVHLTVVVSALLAGEALGLPISSEYYFVIVPVTVLVGAMPISPQGIGVMEVTAYGLMTAMSSRQVHGQDVIALTMSIRVVQMFWNMVGGIFVVTGHYRAPKGDANTEIDEPATTTSGS